VDRALGLVKITSFKIKTRKILIMLLPLIGAGLGGYEAYRQSGGSLGATALGAGLGAVTPSALRMAGTALGGTALGARALGGLSSLGGKAMQSGLGAQAAKMGVKLPSGPLTAAGLGTAAVGAGMLLGAPNLAGALAAGVAPTARSAASGAAGMGVGRQQPSGAFDGSGAVPGGLPAGAAPYNPLDVASPTGPMAANRLAGLMEGDVQLENMKKMMPYLFQAAEARSKTEMQRQLAAAGVRQNIVTAANMLERSQQAAQQMGLTAASQAGSALTSQYQYQ
jgi:hypothetical protein